MAIEHSNVRRVPKDEQIPTDKPYLHIQFNNLDEAANGKENSDLTMQIGNIALSDANVRVVKTALAEIFNSL